MPKSKTQTDNEPAASAPLTEKAKEMLTKLEEHYRRGQTANVASDPGKLQRTLGLNEFTFRKERQFAKTYSEDEFQHLCALRRGGATDAKPLHWGHVVYLLTIEDKGKRRQFEKQAAERNWTAPQLLQAIRQEFPETKNKGGRRLKPADTLDGRLEQLEFETNQVRKRLLAVWSPVEEQAFAKGRLSKGHQGQIDRINAALAELRRDIAKAQRKLQDLTGRQSSART